MDLEIVISNLNHFNFFALTFIGFSALYFSFCVLSFFFLSSNHKFEKVQKKSIRNGQIKTEIQRSFVSIFMFSLLGIWICEGLKRNIYAYNYNFNITEFAIEVLVLFLWNEIYFYLVHRLFHLKFLYKYHIDHHYSNVPTPFSAYSFHWTEGLLLGAVMPIVMLFHDFQIYSIMLLPFISLSLNVLGHSNVDFFPRSHITSLLSFSKRHSLHHQNPHTHYGFFLPWFDQIFGGNGKNGKS